MRNASTSALLGIAVGVCALVPSSAPAAQAADTTATATKTISMTGSKTFLPSSATVVRGTVVTWKNVSRDRHNTTSNTGLWKATVLPGGTYSRTFRTVGTYRYRCTLHSGMTGRIVVVAP